MKFFKFLFVAVNACEDKSNNCDKLSVKCGNSVVNSLCQFTCNACDAVATSLRVNNLLKIGKRS